MGICRWGLSFFYRDRPDVDGGPFGFAQDDNLGGVVLVESFWLVVRRGRERPRYMSVFASRNGNWGQLLLDFWLGCLSGVK